MNPKKPSCDKHLRIHFFHQRHCILSKTRCVDHYFEKLAHFVQKLLYIGPFQDIDIMKLSVDFDGDDVVGVFLRPFEAGVDQCFIQVEH